ncbi:MAG: hypothetical protein GX256_09180, partial [Fretibacterium sp.]|nr:hypothetical protein [Fretibacterium sp.]
MKKNALWVIVLVIVGIGAYMAFKPKPEVQEVPKPAAKEQEAPKPAVKEEEAP